MFVQGSEFERLEVNDLRVRVKVCKVSVSV